MESGPIHDAGSNIPVKRPGTNSLLIPAVVPTTTDNERDDSTNTLNLEELLSFSTTDTDVAFMTNPTYRKDVPYGISSKKMYTYVGFLDTEAGVKLTFSAQITPGRSIFVKKKDSLAGRQIAIIQLRQIEGFIMLHLCLEDLCSMINSTSNHSLLSICYSPPPW